MNASKVDENNLQSMNSRSRQNLLEPGDRSLEPQTYVPEFLTGRIHTQPTLSRQASTSNITLNTTLQDPPAQGQDQKIG